MSAILVGIKRSLEVGINSSQLPKKARKTEGVLMKICQYLPKRFATHNVLVTEDKLERSVRKLGQRKITEYFHTEGPTSIHQTVLCVDNRAGYIRKIISMIPSFPVINIARPFKTYSATYEMGSIDLPNIGIGFINGINNDSDYAKESALRISGYAQGVKVYGVYNATHSAPLDLLECVAGHCGVRTPPVRLLKDQWNRFIATQGPDARFLQICHSAGAIHVLNALCSSSRAIRDRIIVLAIAPAKIIPKIFCYRAYNYGSKQDLVPSLDLVGRARYSDQIVMLEPHRGAPSNDHCFNSPTFHDIIKDTMTAYLLSSY